MFVFLEAPITTAPLTCEKKERKRIGKSTNTSSSSSKILSYTEDFNLLMNAEELIKIQLALENNFKPTIAVHSFSSTKKLQKLNNNSGATVDNVLWEEFNQLTEHLSEGGERILNEPNAGGGSTFSEVLSFEVLHKLLGAELLCTEMELIYYPIGSKKTDYSVKINGKKYGVSVTRCFDYMNLKAEKLSEKYIKFLLEKKLSGVQLSSENIVKKQRWEKQILHIWVPNENVANQTRSVYRKMKSRCKANTIVIITVASETQCVFLEGSNTL
ncbi:hypothetical protein ABK040_010152 [Willaertia magna]